MKQPTNIDYKSIEEQINEILPLVDHATNAEISIALHGTLLERDAIARQEEREKAVEAMADITGDLILADIMRKYLTPNDKE